MYRTFLLAFAALALGNHAFAATTVAVLPLDQGVGSETHAGLGTALSGMLIADLSGAEGLVLVERTRLDAVLSEIALTKTGFLDPATAQKLGKGLGAQAVVAGSWSVVGETFLLDVRLVDVESSRILKAEQASGTVGDFVAVEKEVAEGLLAGLEVVLDSAARRRLMVETPTESFPAFAAYGEGLALRDDGQYDEAAKAFERALGADPEFDEARAELAAVSARVESMRAEDVSRALTDRERRLLAVIAGTADERTVDAKHKDDLDDLARWGLRLSALEELGRDCERYEEMRHFLDRKRGAVTLPPETSRPYVLVEALSKHAWALGLEEKEYPDDTYSHDMRIMDAGSILANPQRFLLDLEVSDPGNEQSEGMWHSMTACLPREAHVQGLVKLREALKGWGVTAKAYDRYDVPFEDILEGFELRMRVQRAGSDPTIEARVTALLDAHENGPGRSWATGLAESVVDDAVSYEKHQARRQGLPEDVLLGMARAVAAKDPAYVKLDAPGCGVLVERASPAVTRDLARYEENIADRPRYAPWDLSSAGVDLAALLDFGCIAGIPARFASPEEAAAWLDDGASRLIPAKAGDEDCKEAWTSFAAHSWTSTVTATSGETQWRIADGGLTSWYGSIEGQLCAAPARRTAP